LPLQARAGVTPPISEAVERAVNKMDNAASAVDIERKEWEDNRQKKVTDAIARAMKQWDDEHYPRLLQASWGWHPFYSSFLANPLCVTFIPSYPLSHSVVEGWDAAEVVGQQSQMERVYPVPWSALLLRCFFNYHSLLPPILLHPRDGLTGANIREWLKFAQESESEGSRKWQQATTYLKSEGFVLYAGARPVDSQQQWVAGVEQGWKELRKPTRQWWAELRHWCNATQIRAVQDMAKHDRQMWVSAWLIRDPPSAPAPSLARYERWLQFREDLDIGYVLANPGILVEFHFIHSSLNMMHCP
jgi:hypothetical protein